MKSTQYLGFSLVLISSVAISLVDVKKLKFTRAFPLMVAASLLTALVAILAKYVYQFVNFWSGFIFISTGMGIAAFFFMIFFRKGRKFVFEFTKRFKKYIFIFIIAELLNIGAVLLSNLAMSKGPVSLVKVIEGIQPIYVLVFALAFFPVFPKYFREALHGQKLKKILLMIVMIIGLYFIHV